MTQDKRIINCNQWS